MATPQTLEQLQEILNDGSLEREMKDTAKKWWGDAVAEAKAEAKPKIVRPPFTGKAHEHNPYSPGAVLDGSWEHFGEFLLSAHQFVTQKKLDDRLAKAALAEGAGESGGFLVPEEFRAQLFALAIEEQFFRPLAFTIPMGSATIRVPTVKDTSHASTVYGGVAASWEGEAATLDESEPTFSQMQLIARKLTGYTVSGNELLADSAVALEALLMRLFGSAITWFEEEAFLNGTGAGQPLGIVNAPCKVTVAKEAGQAAATILYENINNMYSRMLPTSRKNAIWIANIDTMPQLASMALSIGTGGSAVWIQPGGAVGSMPLTIWGRPIYFTEHAQTLGTEGDLIFVDPAYYVIGDRQQLQMAASPHVRFTTDETVWRFVERLDGKPWLESPLTPRHSSNTLSPIVTLATRA